MHSMLTLSAFAIALMQSLAAAAPGYQYAPVYVLDFYLKSL